MKYFLSVTTAGADGKFVHLYDGVPLELSDAERLRDSHQEASLLAGRTLSQVRYAIRPYVEGGK